MLRPVHIFAFCASCAILPLSVGAQTHGEYPPWYGEDNTPRASTHVNDALPRADDIALDDLLDNQRTPAEKPSAIEAAYSNRVIDDLRQFGYDLFAQDTAPRAGAADTMPMGAVQDDFVLNTGDELLITFTGQRTDQKTYKVDSRGMIVVQDISPIPAMGRTIKQLRESLTAALSSMPNTEAYISLSSVRQINILVVGNVSKPGRKTLSAFHTVLDALTQAGGIKKDGSLREIKLVRGGRSTKIDLYALLMHGAPHIDMALRDGDRLIIPPIGPTVAIAGTVKRPGIYEIRQLSSGLNKHMRSSSEALNLNQMLDFAGGVISPGQNRFVMLSPSYNGQETVTEIDDPFSKSFKEGAILSVASGEHKRAGKIELTGHTSRPGLYDITRHKTLKEVLKNQDSLGPDIYPLIGVIERWNSDQLSKEFISFSVRSVLKNEYDINLTENDSIIILSNTDISNIYDDNYINTHSIDNIEQGSRYSDSEITDYDGLIPFLKEQSITIKGAVRKPGFYPIAHGVTLDNILATAGGLTIDADTSSIELTSTKSNAEPFTGTDKKHKKRTTISFNDIMPENVSIHIGDSIRVNQKFKKTNENSVMIIGEVLRPGEYDLLPGDHVSDLIDRAGGLTQQAYPDGSIFSRESERRAEEMKYRADANEMERALARALQNDKKKPDSTQIELVQSLAKQLQTIEAVGRITVETDPNILDIKPELDMLLEKGDRIYIPKRPLSVRVRGEVLSPSSLQFISEKDPIDYIHEAGGFTYHADKDRAFVLYPDGSAQPLQVSAWNHKSVLIPPGSTIIVPRDPEPFSFIESAREVGQILSNMAVTAVFIDDIRD